MTTEEITTAFSCINIVVVALVVGRFIYSRSRYKLKSRIAGMIKLVEEFDFKIPDELVCDCFEHKRILTDLAKINESLDALRSRIRLELGEKDVLLYELDIIQERLDLVSIRILEATTLEDTLHH